MFKKYVEKSTYKELRRTIENNKRSTLLNEFDVWTKAKLKINVAVTWFRLQVRNNLRFYGFTAYRDELSRGNEAIENLKMKLN